jgi:pSer/pThr/pTyr-binding forkhead associated (FHA) protein
MEETRARVIVRLGSQPEEVYLLDANLTTLGRESTNDIVIADYEVSRRHARILHKDDGYSIEDLGSTNGTFVNGYRLAGQAQLFHGDTIEFGQSVSIDFLAEPKAVAKPDAAEAVVAAAIVAEAMPEKAVAEVTDDQELDAEEPAAEEPAAQEAVVATAIAATAVAEEITDEEPVVEESVEQEAVVATAIAATAVAEEIVDEELVAEGAGAEDVEDLDDGEPLVVEDQPEVQESLDDVDPVLEEPVLEEEEAPPVVEAEDEVEQPVVPVLPPLEGTPELLEIPALKVNDAAALPVQDPYPDVNSADLSSDRESAGCSRYLFGCGCLLLVLLGGVVLMVFLLDMFAPDLLYCGPLRSTWDSLNPILTLFGRQSVCP